MRPSRAETEEEDRAAGRDQRRLSQARFLDITLENAHLLVKSAEGLEVGASSSWDAGSPAVAETRPGEAESMAEGPLGAQGLAGQGTRGRRAHTQRVLNVDQPAIKSGKLGDQDQLIGHRAVRAPSPARKASQSRSPSFHSVMKVPVGQEKRRSGQGIISPLTQQFSGCGSCRNSITVTCKKIVSIPNSQCPQISDAPGYPGQGPEISVRQ